MSQSGGRGYEGAKLICTDLRNTNLSRTRLEPADVCGAMLDGAFGFMLNGKFCKSKTWMAGSSPATTILNYPEN